MSFLLFLVRVMDVVFLLPDTFTRVSRWGYGRLSSLGNNNRISLVLIIMHETSKDDMSI